MDPHIKRTYRSFIFVNVCTLNKLFALLSLGRCIETKVKKKLHICPINYGPKSHQLMMEKLLHAKGFSLFVSEHKSFIMCLCASQWMTPLTVFKCRCWCVFSVSEAAAASWFTRTQTALISFTTNKEELGISEVNRSTNVAVLDIFGFKKCCHISSARAFKGLEHLCFLAVLYFKQRTGLYLAASGCIVLIFSDPQTVFI